jgi:hypothetical protein
LGEASDLVRFSGAAAWPRTQKQGTAPDSPRLASVSVGAAILVGAVTGLVLGIVVSVTTGLPLAPEVGLALGALAGWLWRRGAE